MSDAEEFSFEVFCRPEAMYLRAQWQDVRGTWWQSDYVVRIEFDAGADGLAQALADGCRATRRDLPAPNSWADSPPDPGVSRLLEASGRRSVRAFMEKARVYTIYMADGTVEVCAARVTRTSLTGLGSTKQVFRADDSSSLFAVLVAAGSSDTD